MSRGSRGSKGFLASGRASGSWKIGGEGPRRPVLPPIRGGNWGERKSQRGLEGQEHQGVEVGIGWAGSPKEHPADKAPGEAGWGCVKGSRRSMRSQKSRESGPAPKFYRVSGVLQGR